MFSVSISVRIVYPHQLGFCINIIGIVYPHHWDCVSTSIRIVHPHHLGLCDVCYLQYASFCLSIKTLWQQVKYRAHTGTSEGNGAWCRSMARRKDSSTEILQLYSMTLTETGRKARTITLYLPWRPDWKKGKKKRRKWFVGHSHVSVVLILSVKLPSHILCS